MCYNKNLLGLLRPNGTPEVRNLLSELKNVPKIAGIKQLRKALGRGALLRVYLASDADPALTGPLAEACAGQNVPVEWVPSMRELGAACGISVGASAAGVCKPEG